MTPTSSRRDDFNRAYEGEAPWDIGKPQPVLVEAAGQIAGAILDAGCGTGENALFFARLGHEVMGIDFVARAIAAAQRKAQQRGLSATFRVWDALQLADLSEVFDSVIDCGLFHVFSDEERTRYVQGLAQVLKPGGRLFLLCFSDREPPGYGPRRISQAEIRHAFAQGWEVESIREARFEARTDLPELPFSPGGPFGWFCIVRRCA